MKGRLAIAVGLVATGLVVGSSMAAHARAPQGRVVLTSWVDYPSRQRFVGIARTNAVYLFSRDTRKTSNCSDECSRVWAPLLTRGRPRVKPGSHVRRRLPGTIRREDGRLQVTYNYHPLYYQRHPSTCGPVRQFGGIFSAVDVAGDAAQPYCGPY